MSLGCCGRHIKLSSAGATNLDLMRIVFTGIAHLSDLKPPSYPDEPADSNENGLARRESSFASAVHFGTTLAVIDQNSNGIDSIVSRFCSGME